MNLGFQDDIQLVDSAPKSVSFARGIEEITIESDSDDENGTALSDTKLLLATTLINDARYGRHGVFKLAPKEVIIYNAFYKFYIHYLVYLLIWFNLSLAIFEKPAVSGYELPYWATMIMEYVCIFAFAICLFHKWYIAPDGCFWSDKKNILLTGTIIATFIDMLMYSIFMETGNQSEGVRWSRVLRPVYLVNLEGRQIRRAFRNIRRTVAGVVNVLVLLLLAIGLFALLALKLFENRKLKDIDGYPYFHEYFESYYQLYIFTTTANSPDVGIPAYDSNNWFALFFFVFLVICMYIFLSILLAVVYTNYRKHLKNEVRKSVYRKRRQLKLAFDLIHEKANMKWVLSFERWKALLQALCPHYSPGKVRLLWHVLDRTNQDYIEVKDFLMVPELLRIRVIEVKEEVHLFEKICPKIYLSWLSLKIRQMVCHRYFLYFFDLVIFVNAIFIALSFEMAEAIFLVLFNAELWLKLYTYGCREFFMTFWNTFDFIVIESATIAFVVELTSSSVTSSQAAVDFLMILRVLRLIKVMGTIERFKVVINTVMQIGPSIAIYGGILFILFYVYAILGMEIFNGRIRSLGYPNNTSNMTKKEFFCGNTALKNSEFYNEHYCGDNFNDIFKSLKILFDLMIVNQWHILTQGFVLVTNKAARFYFVSFHLICVILVLNIFVAFIIEAFMLQYTLSHGKFETELEKVIQEKGVGIGMTPLTERSRAGTTLSVDMESATRGSRKMTVEEYARNEERRYRLMENQINTAESLLQHMFEDEIGAEDMGPESLVAIDELEPVEVDWRKMTFDTIG